MPFSIQRASRRVSDLLASLEGDASAISGELVDLCEEWYEEGVNEGYDLAADDFATSLKQSVKDLLAEYNKG